jgi:protein-tyrosine phosphatase
MNKICVRLYQGKFQAAQDMRALKDAGITHVLQVSNGVKPCFPKDFVYKVINITDTSNSSLIRYFPAAISFIQEGIRKGGVLVHCYAGVSRSASCVIEYLMQQKDMSFQAAFAFASKRRPVIFPIMGF